MNEEESTNPSPLKVFYSYSHKDEAHRETLETHLALLKRQGLIEGWSDRRLLAGDNWSHGIDKALEAADLILFLVSADFIASDYCYGKEMTRALERHDAEEAVAVPVIVRACDWQSAPFGRIQGVPKDGKPVTSWPNSDEAWLDVAKGLRRLIEARRKKMAAQAQNQDPQRYLKALNAKHSSITLAGMGAKVAERLPLEQVYTRLRVAAGGAGRSGAKAEADLREPRDLSLAEVLRDNPSAVLVGDPGSGKTTFLRFAAQVLARHHLGLEKGKVEERLGLTGEAPFPILVFLSELADFLSTNASNDLPEKASKHLLRFLEFSLTGKGFDLPKEYLRRRWSKGGCFLLLDGLDEVPEAQRPRIGAIVENLVAEGRENNHYLVTCRTRAYEGQARLETLPNFQLADFGPQQVEEFTGGWCRALHKVKTGDATSSAALEAEAYRKALLSAIATHPNAGPFARNPLMLTMLALVFEDGHKLPEQRADLYLKVVEYLLTSRQKRCEYPDSSRREGLQAVALKMMTHPEGLQVDFGMREAAEAAAEALAVNVAAAEAFLHGETLHSGLLVSRRIGEVRFWHLTFQEFLAARELATRYDYWDTIKDHLYDDQWSEVLLLLGGALVQTNGMRAARDYLKKILATGTDLPSKARAVGLTGRVLEDLRSYFSSDPAEGTSFATMLHEVLCIFSPPEKGEEILPETVRIEVGEALGQAGDPRLQNESELRVRLEGGTFLMGAQDKDTNGPGYDEKAYPDEGPVRTVTLSSFEIGRYPVTVGEYRSFLESGSSGYLDPRCWDPKGWAWREVEGIEEPKEWAAQLRHPNRPVVGVSWFEADAYSRWAGGRLPMEDQWEFAARGEVGRKYPWGNAPGPTGSHANFDDRVKTPSSVGAYPLGATPEGIQDLAGNVLEWCSEWWKSPLEGEDLTASENRYDGPTRVVRGGAFPYNAEGLRGALRNYRHPHDREADVGFRVVFVSG